MSDGINPERFDKLCDNVSEIMVALKGSEDYRQKGALQRIDENEERSWDNKNKIDRAWWYIIGAGAMIGFIIKAIDWIG